MSMTPEPIVLYTAGWQLVKVRFLMILSLATLAATLWASWYLANHYGINPADGGKLAPWPVRAAWAGGVAMFGVFFACGMAIFGHCYVARIEYDAAGDTLRIFTTRFVGLKLLTCAISDVASSHHRVDHARGTAIPWLAVRLKGRRWPLIVDLQGNFPDQEEARRYLRDRIGLVSSP